MESLGSVFIPVPIRREVESDDDPEFTLGDEFARPVEPIEDAEVQHEQQPSPEFTCGNNRKAAITAAQVDIVADIPMYPPSNPEGYALIVPITTGYNGEVPTTKEILKRALQIRELQSGVPGHDDSAKAKASSALAMIGDQNVDQ
ncbi:hypothetical protein BU23DRAFT_574907 [Bimuria novae-zelandiae CBS 107.79]|uniref:Uncharacterized protein n=1 Tax=Bimuria novae-zelandiae CBS 107.79 TaxID=1447943 RepID=A0A6A5UL46_9PLEO|nr:hypothetical protein BU23DRAFT_574907 [Bimuria novae-zelandiae CBS 107.79]